MLNFQESFNETKFVGMKSDEKKKKMRVLLIEIPDFAVELIAVL